ncbi:MAG TPA: RNA 2',3'-cyclic phosphodiesterase [Clostridiaceae bacterium]|nr:RNA 2',3'-cyclic phosphodiesterase [Clostridiaceae bacterium]
MRLFIAINFDDQMKNRLHEITQKLKSVSNRGNFTRKENFHLTVVFIGETNKINIVKQIMDKICAEPFDITIGRLGKFQRNGGDIYWVGVENNEYLSAIYNQLAEELASAGFNIEKRSFRPHLTLGREVILSEKFDEKAFSNTISPMTIRVERISLMKSERINGVLTYTEVYGKELHKG